MNDVRNLMQTLQGDMEYREFAAPAPSPAEAGGWAMLERVKRAAAAPQSAAPHPAALPPAARQPAPAPAQPVRVIEAISNAEQAVAAPPAAQMHSAAVARGRRGLGQLSLGKYSAPEPAAARDLPLSEVFAHLARGG